MPRSYSAPRATSTYLFAGGGTGGHIFPGLAIAESLESLAAAQGGHILCLFLCSNRPLDARILAPYNRPFHILPAAPLSVRPRALVRFAAAWGPSIRATRALIRAARTSGPVHMVAMGGFVAAPAVQAARAEHIPITLANLDAVPGKANRWIARHAHTVFTALPVSATYAETWTTVPPIVRAAARATSSKSACRAALGLSPDRSTLMVTGGSQGARTINRLLFDLAPSPALRGWQVLHQCGNTDGSSPSIDDLRTAYAAASIPSVVAPFVTTMSDWWGAADLAISRSGAGSVGEAWANQVPALFLPYPYHRDQHQKFNAAPLVSAGAGLLTEDCIDPAANLASIGPLLAGLLTNPDTLASMTTAYASLDPADGARRIADSLFGLPAPANLGNPANLEPL
ncbi:MAG: UDP-N-acetylglucosamine--N-acetylmuramyl-(pentapeptide) pyrophosphoryl-undecaprenol N-acetylglucosamine transferase [Phycisphaerales bacterium]|nr:UDP-N-acetylglucosamine--N-acetylmuramyl-(pentapeptide) pyrophosphoryl-undecaprenol N-acetylglucosamine transferase [Phycisphaerales bacterium]